MRKGRETRAHRLTVRLPDHLNSALETVAEEDRRSVADWIVVTVESSLTSYRSEHPPVWIRRKASDNDHRLTVRLPKSLLSALKELVTADRGPPSVNYFILMVIERAIAERAALKKPSKP